METNISGLQNENNFTDALNCKEYCQLEPNAAKFIKQLYPSVDDNTTIHAVKVGGKGLKPDVVVSVQDDDTNVSIKKGGGNSVHQEKITLFLLYCKDYLGMTDDERDSFLSFLYGDGTLDGKGQTEDRLDGKALQEKYKTDIDNIQAFLLKNSRALIERFLVYGRRGKELNFKADYLYHGLISDGVWCPLDETVDFLVEKANERAPKNMPAIGPLTLQTWNRNLSGNPKLEERRNSIQIKWGGQIKQYITEINDIYIQKIKQNPSLAIPRIFGDNSHGFSNAKEIAAGLNGCRIRNLRGSLLGLINTMFVGAALTDVISCKVIKKGKPDLKITVGNKTVNVSVFIGSGNSVHQENFIEFLSYCRNSLGMRKAEEDALRLIYWGDGTLDGTGLIENRLKDSRTIKQRYPKETSVAQRFFDEHRRNLARRFLVTGKYYNMDSSDCVFHGDVQNGIALSYDDVLDYIEKYDGESNGLLSIGPLSFQMWNRNLGGEPEKEYKRESLQIKWASMSERIKEASAMKKTKETRSKINGINAEYELVSLLNRDRSNNNPLWASLKLSLDLPNKNVFAVRVSSKVDSPFLGQKVFPKSDLYLCKANLSESLLEEMGYAFDEDIAKEYGVNLEPINGSGISCKISTSTKYTYSKISPSNFSKIFGSSLLGAAASVFVKGSDIKLNSDILKAWNVNEIEFMEFLNQEVKISGVNSIADLTEHQWSKIKDFSNRKILHQIKENKGISDMIFLGKGLYDDPYYAPFIFSYGELKENIMPEEFVITTGSGRHKGKYTIVVKPSQSSSSKVIKMHKSTEMDESYISMVAENSFSNYDETE